MNIALIDDNDESRRALESAIQGEQPSMTIKTLAGTNIENLASAPIERNAKIRGFSNATIEQFTSMNAALASDFTKSCDIAFVSTELPVLTSEELSKLDSTYLTRFITAHFPSLIGKKLPEHVGIQLARRLQQDQPKMNIIFVSNDDAHCLEALSMYCSGYIRRPVTDESVRRELTNLRFPVPERVYHRLQAHCFGNFEVFFDGKPVPFERTKTREMFAYLINRMGMLCSNREIEAVLWEDQLHADSYPRVVRSDMKTTLERLGADDVIVRYQGRIGINVNALDCDYYDYLRYLAGAQPNKPFFSGQYMSQYSWAEPTLAYLQFRKN